MEGRDDYSFRLEDYDYDLPQELIAQFPTGRREKCRLLVLDRTRNDLRHSCFEDLRSFFDRGDLLVVNDTRVVQARLLGHKSSGGKVELLVLDPYKPPEKGASEGYCCLVKSSKGVRAGLTIELKEGVRARVVASLEDGKALVCFPGDCGLLEILDRIGEVPLPPYITRAGAPAPVDDQACYQTEYARTPGAVAAPTAGLHFTKGLMQDLKDEGIETAAITLHVGYGTFAPVRCEDIREHRIHSEFVEMDESAAEAINRAKRDRRHIVAVGTTVVRTLEWIHSRFGELRPFSGMCNHFIYPGYSFGVVDHVITNFHLPKSSLILLVSAFTGRSTILSAYREAINERYRFFSYGDAMLIL